MKKLTKAFGVLIIFISILFQIGTQKSYAQTSSLTNNKRGMYVNNFLEVTDNGITVQDFSILGITAKENALLNFADKNHIRYLILYDMTEIFNNDVDLSVTQRQNLISQLKAFINKAKTVYHIEEIGALIPGDDVLNPLNNNGNRIRQSTAYEQLTTDDIAKFPNLEFVNQNYSETDALASEAEITKLGLRISTLSNNPNEMFDFLSIEYEFWNYATNGTTFSGTGGFQDISEHMADIKILHNQNPLYGGHKLYTEIYYDNPTNDAMSDQLAVNYIDGDYTNTGAGVTTKLFDRILTTFYSRDPERDGSTPPLALTDYDDFGGKLDLFENTSTNNGSITNPLFASGSPRYGASDDFYRTWFYRGFDNNIFVAERIFYDAYLRDVDNSNTLAANKNIISPGAATWYASGMMVGLPKTDPAPLVKTNSPICVASNSTGNITLRYIGPIENGVSNFSCKLSGNGISPVVRSTSNIGDYKQINKAPLFVNPTNPSTDHIVLGDITNIPENSNPYTLTSIITYSNGVTYSSSQEVYVVSTPIIIKQNTGVICDGESVALKAVGLANWYEIVSSTSTQIPNTGLTQEVFIKPSVGSHIYNYTLSSSGSCSANSSGNITVVVNSNPDVIITKTPTTCGTTLAISSGGSSYSWSTNSTGSSILVTQDGTYKVIVTQSNTCTNIGKAVINNVSGTGKLQINFTHPNIICKNGTSSLVRITPSTGTAPYTYTWKHAGIQVGTGTSLSGVVAGDYSLTVVDANGCSDTRTETLEEPYDADAGDDEIRETTCGLTSTILRGNTPNIGTGEWSIISGTGGSFTTGAGNPSNSDLPNATFTGNSDVDYVLRWTISNPSCNTTDDVQIRLNSIPVVSISSPAGSCAGEPISASLSGTNTLPIYSWSPSNETTPTINPSIDGTYTVTATNDYGCVDDENITISGMNYSCCANASGGVFDPNNFSNNTSYNLNSDLNVGSGGLNLTGITLYIAKDVKINITANGVFELHGCHLLACGEMWDGIYAEKGTSVVFDGQTIMEDAIHGLVSSEAILLIDNSTFNHNKVSLDLQRGSYSTSHIRQCTFDCSDGKISKEPFTGNLSGTHINLDNVTDLTIGFEGSSYTNTFKNAIIGINSVDSKYSAINNSFDWQSSYAFNKTEKRYAIFATNDSYYYTDFSTTLGGTATRANTFHNWTYGSIVFGGNAFNSQYNTYTDCYYSTFSEYSDNVTFSNNIASGYYRALHVQECINSSINIVNNNFNQAQTNYNPQKYGTEAIRVDNTWLSYSPITIANNNINNTAIGIHLTNLEGNSYSDQVVIDNNEFKTSVPPSDCNLYSTLGHVGVMLSNCNYTLIKNNEMLWTETPTASILNNLKGSFSGIGIQNCISTKASENNVSKFSAGFDLFGDNSVNTRLNCNTMDKCYNGVWLNDNSANNKLSDQGVWTGNPSTSISWNNVFENNIDNHVDGTIASSLNPIKWMYSSATDDPNPNPFVVAQFDEKPCSLTVSGCTPPAMMMSEEKRNSTFGDALEDLSEIEIDPLEYSYNNNEAFYKYANQNANILNLNTSSDIIYQNKFEELQTTDIGKFEDAKLALTDKDLALALESLQNMESLNLIDANKKFMGSLIALEYEVRMDADSDTISIVTNIANMHPFYGGEAVYMARAMLHLDVKDALSPARKAKQIKINKQITYEQIKDKFYPNPASDVVVLNSSQIFAENEQLNLYNSLGLFVKSFNLPSNLNSFKFSSSILPPGIYYGEINLFGVSRQIEKLVIIK
jgi:hypothetical protein